MFDPESYLNSLEAIGWKLGLERMEALSAELGRPQDRYDTVHVVGTNGKSSVARMIAALVEAHGPRTGCSLSPHLSRWSERVLVAGRELDPRAFSAAVAATAAAAEAVNATLEEGEAVTQFEVATAAAFLALADAGVEVASIEAGLGGRLDATNSINSKVTVLTSIGLDHTEWLGETEPEIAGEKLAVLRPVTKLVIGRLDTDIEELARRHAASLGCEVTAIGERELPEFEMTSQAGYQHENFAVAVLAVEALLGYTDEAAVRSVAATVTVPGRLERINADPPVFIDVAHNRPGAAALAASVPWIADGRPVIAVIAVLGDKDGAGMMAELAPVIDIALLAELPGEALAASGRPGARTFPAAELAALAEGLGVSAEVVPDARKAMSRAVSLAEEQGGVVLVAGSHYLSSAVGNG